MEVATTLLSESGREVFRSTQPLAVNSANDGKNSTFTYATTLPLADVEAGRYLLRVEAAARGSGNVNGIQNSVRETLITIK